MTHALCPGSFDPVTFGHIDVIQRTAVMFDRVTVLVMQNAAKTPLFTAEERCDMLREVLKDIPNVTVDCAEGLLATYAVNHGITAIVKGVRNSADYLYETDMATANRNLGAPETVFLPSLPQFSHISTTTAMALYRANGDTAEYLPAPVRGALEAKYPIHL